MKRFLVNLRRLLWTLGAFLLLFGAAVWLENWTGARALAAAKLRLTQAGETLDFAALLPKPVPDEVNFCALPALVGITLPYREGDTSAAASVHQNLNKLDWFRGQQLSADVTLPVGSRKPPPALTNGCTLAQPLDLAKAADYLREVAYIDTAAGASPAEILASLDRLHPVLKKLSDAAPGRPEARLMPATAAGRQGPFFLDDRSYMMPLNTLARALALRSQVAAAAGDAGNAARSLLAIRRLTQAMEGDPTLIGLLINGGVTGHELHSLWSLLRTRTADDVLLALLQRELERQDIMDQALQAARGELVFQTTTTEWCRDHPEERIKIILPQVALDPLGDKVSW